MNTNAPWLPQKARARSAGAVAVSCRCCTAAAAAAVPLAAVVVVCTVAARLLFIKLKFRVSVDLLSACPSNCTALETCQFFFSRTTGIMVL